MIRRFVAVSVFFVLMTGGIFVTRAASYVLNDGSTLAGEPISVNAQGLIVKMADGSFAPRMGWTNFTQAALKELAMDPKAKPFVEPYLDLEEAEEKKPSLVIKPKAHERLERPDPKAGMGAMFSSPITIILFLLVYAGNIYAGLEIAIFRNYLETSVALSASKAKVLLPTTVTVKALDDDAIPSLTATVTVAVPVWSVTGLTVMVRFVPLAPITRSWSSTSEGFEELAVTVRLGAAVSISPTVNGIGPVDPFLGIDRSIMIEIVGTSFTGSTTTANVSFVLSVPSLTLNVMFALPY